MALRRRRVLGFPANEHSDEIDSYVAGLAHVIARVDDEMNRGRCKDALARYAETEQHRGAMTAHFESAEAAPTWAQKLNVVKARNEVDKLRERFLKICVRQVSTGWRT